MRVELTWQEALALNLLMMGKSLPDDLKVDVDAAWEKNEIVIDQIMRPAEKIDIYLTLSLGEGNGEYFRNAAELIDRLRHSTVCLTTIISPASFAASTPLKKGDISRWICYKTKCGFLYDPDEPSWGKYSEAMDMLKHGKQVVHLVGEDKYNLMLNQHPRRIVGPPLNGNGMHTVSTYEKGVECLNNILYRGAEPRLRIEEDGAFANHFCTDCGSLIKREFHMDF